MRKTIIGFFKKEFIQALRDPKMRALLIVAPIVQMTVFGLALSNEVRNVRIAAHAEQNDTILRDIIRDSLASGWFIPDGSPSEVESEGLGSIKSGRAEVVLLPPEGGVTKAFERGEGRLQILIDSADLIRARTIENYLRTILSRSLKNYGVSASKPPVRFDVRILYNPDMKTSDYLVPGVMCMLICLITILLTSMSIAKEKEMGTFEMIISAPVRVIDILLGKTVPFFIIGIFNVPLIAGVAILGFKVPMRGSYLELALATVFFLLTTVSVGTLISTISRNQQQAMMGSFIFLMPAILLSGIMFPIDNMPLALKGLAHLDPLMYYITILRNIMLKGGDPYVLWTNTGILALIALATMTAAYKRFRLNLG